MPITSSAKKALRGSLKKHAQNEARREAVRQTIKTVKKAAGKATIADVASAYKAIDKALKRGIIKKNTAARRKALVSRLAKKTK
jgi:ribosomal protein S20